MSEIDIDGEEILDTETVNIQKLSYADSLIDNNSVVLFASLNGNEKPNAEIPSWYTLDIEYNIRFKDNCNLCKSPYRSLAEGIYIQENRHPQAVVRFFLQYFNARISWASVDSHMKAHCDLSRVSLSGIKHLIARRDEFGIFTYRTLELARIGLLTEIDDIRGMDLNNKPILMMKRSVILKDLYNALTEVDVKMQEEEKKGIDIFKVLSDLYQSINDTNSREMIKQKLIELRSNLIDK